MCNIIFTKIIWNFQRLFGLYPATNGCLCQEVEVCMLGFCFFHVTSLMYFSFQLKSRFPILGIERMEIDKEQGLINFYLSQVSYVLGFISKQITENLKFWSMKSVFQILFNLIKFDNLVQLLSLNKIVHVIE